MYQHIINIIYSLWFITCKKQNLVKHFRHITYSIVYHQHLNSLYDYLAYTVERIACKAS